MYNRICKYLAIFILFLWLLPAEAAIAAGTLPKGVTIAGIAFDGLTYEKAREKVQAEVDIWSDGEPIQAEGSDEAISIPRDSFLFDIDRTFNDLEQQTKRPWYLFFLKPKPAHLPLHVQVKEDHSIEWPEYIDAEATLEKAKEDAANLKDHPVSIIYKEEPELKKGTVSEASLSIPENIAEVEIEQMAEQINSQTIDSETQFSLISAVLEDVQPSVSQEGASFFATAMYALVLKTNMDMIERHSQGNVPPYSEAGIEALVDATTKKDFIIYNPNFHSYTFSAEVKGNKLHLSLSSVLKDSGYDYQVENKSEIKPRTLYRFSPKLAPGSRVPMESGQKGIQVEVYRVHTADGKVQEKTLISRDFYPPSPTIFLVSSQEPPEVIDELLNEEDASLEETESSDASSTEDTEGQSSQFDKEEMLNIINKAACQQFEDDANRKACQQILIDNGLKKDSKEEAESNTKNEPEDENEKG